MRIDSSLPAHVARAYGLKPAQPCCEPSRPGFGAPVKAAAPIQPSPAPRVSEISGKLTSLVAGRVPGGIDPRTTAMSATPSNSSDVLQLYTRAADRVEAATSIQLGRALDVTG